ncbi:MAG: hypothetical protein ACK5LS_07085 [Propioniciclava sp.]
MQQRFRDVLAAQPVAWHELVGSPEQRLTEAVRLVEPVLTARGTFPAPLEQRPH